MNLPLAYSAVQLAGAACVALLVTAPAHADIYRCVNAAGDVSYSDSPCQGEAMSSNITESVGACTTPECEAQVERARASAEERLRAERAALAEMQDRRLRSEEVDLQRKFQRQQEQLQYMEAQLADQRAASSGVYYPSYPMYPWVDYPGVGRPGNPGYGRPDRPCIGAACRPATRPPGMDFHRRPHREPPTSFTLPRPVHTFR